MDKFVEKILNQKLQEGKLSLNEFNFIVNYIEKLIEKEEQNMKNSIEFEHFKLHSDSTLKSMKKDELISYIHMVYHNWSVTDERAEIVIEYVEKFQQKQKPKKPKMMRIKKYDGYNIGICQCGAILDTSMVEEVNYCPKCGQRIDWSDEDDD